jgi:FkbM family methyltransferase
MRLLKKIKAAYKIVFDKKYRGQRKKAIEADKELKRIRLLPKNIPDSTTLLGSDFKFTDGMTFIGALHQIIDREIYKFNSKYQNPYIIDCGANVGLSVLYFKKLFPLAKILAFEPDISIFNILKYNVESFGLVSVELVQKAVWHTKTILNFCVEGNEGGRIEENTSNSTVVNVETEKLSDYLFERVDLLKIDIEGAETKVLYDCRENLKNVDKLFVEYHSFDKQAQTLPELLKIIKDAGFRFEVQREGTTSRNPFVYTEKYLEMDLLVNIFAYRI